MKIFYIELLNGIIMPTPSASADSTVNKSYIFFSLSSVSITRQQNSANSVYLSFNKFYFLLDHTDFFMLTKMCLTLAQVPQDVGHSQLKMSMRACLANLQDFQLLQRPTEHKPRDSDICTARCSALLSFSISANYVE